MSEPTNDGPQKPEPEQDQGDSQDQSSDSVFSDPTAPVWADPTAPMPASPETQGSSAWRQESTDLPTPPPPPPPPPPGTPEPTYSQQPAAPQPTPQATNPYAQQPPVQPPTQPYGQYAQPQPGQAPPQYGQPAPQYGQPAPQYGQAPPGSSFPSYGAQNYGAGASTSPSNTSAIVLTVLSGLSVLTCNILVIGSLVLGIMALTKNAADPEQSRRLSKIGWIVFAAVWGLVLVGFIIFVIVAVNTADVGPSTYSPGY